MPTNETVGKQPDGATVINSICLLSPEEAARLEHFGIWPRCKSHKHLKKSEADELINADTHRYVGGSDTRVRTPVTMIVACITNERVWRNRPSGGPLGYVVKQYVRI